MDFDQDLDAGSDRLPHRSDLGSRQFEVGVVHERTPRTGERVELQCVVPQFH